MRYLPLLTLCALSPHVIACSNEPDGPMVVGHSETISLRLSGIKESDVRDGEGTEEKNIDAEPGNPYGVFLSNARAHLGRDPGHVRVTNARVSIHMDSTGVTGLEQVFDWMELFVGNSATTVAVGRVESPMGSDDDVPVAVNEVGLEPLRNALVGGMFKVGVRGAVIPTAPAQFDMRLSIDIRFEATE